MKGFTFVIPYWFAGLLLLIFVLGSESLVKPSLTLNPNGQVLGQTTSLIPLLCSTSDCASVYEATIAKHPEYIDAYIYLAYYYWDERKFTQAHTYYQQAKYLNPFHPKLEILKRLIY